jgi:DNA-binding transcriptional regulator YiaG
MLCLTRQEFENAALALGFKPATLRQWKHRRKVPSEAKWRMTIFLFIRKIYCSSFK